MKLLCCKSFLKRKIIILSASYHCLILVLGVLVHLHKFLADFVFRTVLFSSNHPPKQKEREKELDGLITNTEETKTPKTFIKTYGKHMTTETYILSIKVRGWARGQRYYQLHRHITVVQGLVKPITPRFMSIYLYTAPSAVIKVQ